MTTRKEAAQQAKHRAKEQWVNPVPSAGPGRTKRTFWKFRLNKCLRKKRYHELERAELVARNALISRGVELEVYKCSLCLQYHLASKSGHQTSA